jgi:hypothetical protein
MPTKFPVPPPSFWRLESLNQVRTRVWDEVYNPHALRLGNKILRKRFRAQAVQDYYPMEWDWTPRKLGRLFPGFTFYDEEREQWEEKWE